MEYKLDRKFIKQNKFRIIAVGLAFVSLGILLTYSMAIRADWEFLFGLFFIYLGFIKFKELKYWESNNNKISLKISQDSVSVSDTNENRSLKINSVNKVILQPIHGHIKSIVLHSSGGEMTKLEGFESMDKIAQQLKELLGESKVKTNKMFHR